MIKKRQIDPVIEAECIAAGLDPILSGIVAARPLSTDLTVLQAITPRLQNLFTPSKMRDIEKAAKRIAKAILNGECIGLETDHDCDGQTSHAVLFYNLVYRFMHPAEKIRSYIGHRLTEGYGLSQSVANRILNDPHRPSLIITADNGSADEPRIAQLKAENIDVIVTDHHEIPKEGCPKSAFACLNPTREDCDYGDPYIAGCMVAWLLMTATRLALIHENYLPENVPSLSDSLDFVAVGTIADCVSMARSINNRAVVSYGLRLIEQGSKPCWRALKSLFPTKLTSEDLGFRIGPLLNSDGRLSTAFGSVSLLLSETEEEAIEWIDALQKHNNERKKIQKELVKTSTELAKEQVKLGRVSLCLYLADGHTGVQGIAASRIKDLFGRPTAIFAPKPGVAGVITGSVRGIDSFHVRDALQNVVENDPDIFLAFGGHKGAGGLTLKLEDLSKFMQLFENAARMQLLPEQELIPIIWTEGELKATELNLELVDRISQLEPFGREFETPLFEATGELIELRAVGDGTHLKVKLRISGKFYNGIWFSAKQSANEELNINVGSLVKIVFAPKQNYFNNQRKLDLNIMHMHEI